MSDFIDGQFKLLSKGCFYTLQGSGNLWKSSNGQSKSENPVFAKTKNGCQRSGLASKFVVQNQKLLIFVNH